MQRYHVRRGDEVVVISGTQKGSRGKIISVITSKDRVIVEGVMMMKKHMKKNRDNPQGRIVEREGSLHISNVMKAAEYDARAAKRGATQPATA